ncbi:MAG: hypothetical protein WCR06_07160 [bacterium]
MQTKNMIACIVLAGGLFASVTDAVEPTALETQLANLRTEVQALNVKLEQREHFLISQEPCVSFAETYKTTDAAFNKLRRDEKIDPIVSARDKAKNTHYNTLEKAKADSPELAALRAKEKDDYARMSGVSTTSEVRRVILEELASIHKQREVLLKAIEELPAVAAAKAAMEVANVAFLKMSTETGYAKLEQARNDALNAMNRAGHAAMKNDATHEQIRGNRDDLLKQILALEKQMQAAKEAK